MALTIAILVALLSVAAGAFGGRWLVRRELGPIIATALASSGRANVAAATVEAADLPALLERIENIDSHTRAAVLTAQKAKESAADAVARQKALEQAVAGALNVSLTTGG